MMNHSPRFGVLVLPNQSWSNILQQAQHVERLGFDLFTMADHFVDWSDVSRPWLEGWSVLTAVAMATSRVRLATYVTQIPLRHPAMLARQALTVDHISNGRLEVGSAVAPPAECHWRLRADYGAVLGTDRRYLEHDELCRNI